MLPLGWLILAMPTDLVVPHPSLSRNKNREFLLMNIRSRSRGWFGLALFAAGAFVLGVVGSSAQQDGPTATQLRVAVQTYNPILVTRNRQGELSGVAVDLANAYAKKLGTTVKFVTYENSVRFNQSLAKDEWDLAFTPRDLSRTSQLAFTEPFLEADNNYIVKPGSSVRSVNEVDRRGMKVAVASGSLIDGYLTRTLKAAEIVRLYNGTVGAREALTFGRVDAYADYAPVTTRLAAEVPGATVLVGRFNVIGVTIAVPKAKETSLTAVNDFLQEASRGGLITDAIKHAGLDGVRVGLRRAAPQPSNPPKNDR